MSQSNVNLNNIANSGNTGRISQFPNPGILRAIALVPAGFIIPPSAMASTTAFATYMAAFFVPTVAAPAANSRQSRWFLFNNLDKFTDESKKTSSEDTGRLQLEIYNFPPKFSFRYMLGLGNFIEAKAFQNCQGQYDYYFIDDKGIWWGTKDPAGSGGLMAYTNQQFYVQSRMAKTVSTDNAYNITVSLADPSQFNENVACYEAGTSPDAIQTLENVVMSDITSVVGTALGIASTTDIVVGAKIGQGSQDFIQAYFSALTAACFVAYNLTTATTLTISTLKLRTVVVSGQSYYCAWLTLSAAPTVGNLVQVTLATPSALNVIIPNANAVVEIITPSQDGANAAVHTF